MTNDDPTLARLAALPDLPLPPRAVAAVRRRARAALAEERAGRLASLRRFWTGVMLPAVLVAAALLYAYDSIQFVERTYVASARG
jgi:hypothetical protein